MGILIQKMNMELADPQGAPAPDPALGAPGKLESWAGGPGCGVALVAYSITHTRQSAIGLPFYLKETVWRAGYSVTEYDEQIVASVYDKMEETGLSEEFFSLMRSTACPDSGPGDAPVSAVQDLQEIMRFLRAGSSWRRKSAGVQQIGQDFDVETLDRVKKFPWAGS